MIDWSEEPVLAALVGLAGGIVLSLAGGIVLGLAARAGRFCALGAIEDWLHGGDTRRLRTSGVASASPP